MSKGVILDTDPGVDDIIAIVYALKAGINPDGITTVHGNSTIENVSQNARFIVEKLGEGDINVYKGTSESLTGRRLFAESSGYDGINGFHVPKHYSEPSKNAVEFIGEQLQINTKTDLLCIGPLTNIAVVFNMYPHLIRRVGKLIIMGGEFTGKGNITPHAEFNSYCDPHAFQYVLDKCEQEHVTTYIIPANVCRGVTLDQADLNRLIEVTSVNELKDIVSPYIDYYQQDKQWGGYEGAVIYDLLVSVFYTHPEYFQLEAGEVLVECNDAVLLGKTTFNKKDSSPIQVVSAADGQSIKNIFFSTLTNT